MISLLPLFKLHERWLWMDKLWMRVFSERSPNGHSNFKSWAERLHMHFAQTAAKYRRSRLRGRLCYKSMITPRAMSYKHESHTARTERDSSQNGETGQISEALSTRFIGEKRRDWMPEKECKWDGDTEKMRNDNLCQSGGKRYSSTREKLANWNSLTISYDLSLRLAEEKACRTAMEKTALSPFMVRQGNKGWPANTELNGLERISIEVVQLQRK